MAKQFPTAQKFAEQLKKKSDEDEKRMETLPWRELTVKDIYRIDSMKEIADCGKFGDIGVVLQMTTAAGLTINVWAASLVAKELRGDGWKKEGRMDFPCYVQPLGMKNCKKDPQRQYHAFQLLTAEEMDC
jgi:hypothetical protein